MCYRESGFVRLRNVFDSATLAHYTPTVSLEVARADQTPLEEDSDYQKAFTQVLLFCPCEHCLYLQQCLALQPFSHSFWHLQITNLWANSKPVEEFVLGQKLGRIAAQLMGVRFAPTEHNLTSYSLSMLECTKTMMSTLLTPD